MTLPIIVNHGTLAEALNSSALILPGSRVLIRGGTYTGDFVSILNGTAEAPITIMPYNNERVIIDGGLIINGNYTHWYDIEKRLTGGVRETDIEGIPLDFLDGGLTVNGLGTWLVNCVIHNQVDNGVGWWTSAGGGLVYGCVIFDNGWLGPDRGHGHGIYTQNIEGSADKIIKHCVLAQGFAPSSGAGATNLAVYGSEGGALRGFDVNENVMIDGQQLMASIGDSSIAGCHIYKAQLLLGYWDNQDSIGVTVTGNRVYGRFGPLYMQSMTAQNNTFIVDTAIEIVRAAESGLDFLGYTMSGNAYHYTGGNAEPFLVSAVGTFTFDGWKARYNCDADSTYQTSLPADSTHVYPNEYKATRGIIVVWNWTEADSVIVDVSSITGIAAGDSYTLRSAIDYFGDVGTGTVAQDGTITIDMRAISHSVSIPDGWDVPLIDTTFPTFATFQIDKA